MFIKYANDTHVTKRAAFINTPLTVLVFRNREIDDK